MINLNFHPKQKSLETLLPKRNEVICQAFQVSAESDNPFTLNEVKRALKTSADTAPGSDKVSYSMLNHLGTKALKMLQLLFNKSLESGCLPTNWKTAIIQPIPKEGPNRSFRPISLISCIGKTMERAILARLNYLIPHPHPNIFAYTKGLSTKDNLASIYALIDGNDSVITFLDIEKAFELANGTVILNILASKKVTGNILRWTSDYLTSRKAQVRFQGTLSDILTFENGTPQGGILSPFLFNMLISELISIPLPANTHLLAYADDLQLIAIGRNRYVHSQMALDQLRKKCQFLGLMINSNKTRALQTGHSLDNQWLYIEDKRIEWVTSHKCLGVFFNSQSDSSTHLQYLLGKTKARINVM